MAKMLSSFKVFTSLVTIKWNFTINFGDVVKTGMVNTSDCSKIVVESFDLSNWFKVYNL